MPPPIARKRSVPWLLHLDDASDHPTLRASRHYTRPTSAVPLPRPALTCGHLIMPPIENLCAVGQTFEKLVEMCIPEGSSDVVTDTPPSFLWWRRSIRVPHTSERPTGRSEFEHSVLQHCFRSRSSPRLQRAIGWCIQDILRSPLTVCKATCFPADYIEYLARCVLVPTYPKECLVL